MTALVEERRERAIVPREDGGHAKVRSRSVVVIARPLGNALTRVSGLLLLLRGFGQAERERIDGAEDGQAAPAQHPEPGRGRQVLCEPECGLEALGSGGVGVVFLEVVTLHDTELELVVLQGLSEQPPAHSGFAQARSAAEAQPHRECVVGCSAVSLVRIPVDRVHLQEWLCVRRERVVLRAAPQHAGCAKRGQVRGHHVRGLVGHARGIPPHESIHPGDRIERGRADLAPQAPAPGGACVAYEPGCTVKHLAERDAAQRRVDEVVQGRVVRLAEILPGGAAEGRHGR